MILLTLNPKPKTLNLSVWASQVLRVRKGLIQGLRCRFRCSAGTVLKEEAVDEDKSSCCSLFPLAFGRDESTLL